MLQVVGSNPDHDEQEKTENFVCFNIVRQRWNSLWVEDVRYSLLSNISNSILDDEIFFYEDDHEPNGVHFPIGTHDKNKKKAKGILAI